MKNLSAIPRLSLSESLTILITLVVCLAGFTEAEVNANYGKEDSNQQEENYFLKNSLFRENLPFSQQASKLADDGPEDRSFISFKHIPESPLDTLIKRRSSDLGEFDEPEQKGNGYVDDEYYHFNFKRSESESDSSKEKQGVSEVIEPHQYASKSGIAKGKEKTKSFETIEMLNFKESHPNIGSPASVPSGKNTVKQFSEDPNRKKLASSLLSSLKMNDLRENSAIDEKMKDRKDESDLSGVSSESKISESKKVMKTEDKDAVKLKDSPLTEEKKEKETSLTDAKEAVDAKHLKDAPDDKEKALKLSENSKLEDSVAKISSKNKESETSKIEKEESGDSKVAAEIINSGGLSQLNTRASFVGNDYKETAASKAATIKEEDKNLEGLHETETNSELLNSQKSELRRNRELLKKLSKTIDGGNVYLRDNAGKIFRESNKENDYSPSTTYSFQSGTNNEYYMNRDWKDKGGQMMKYQRYQQQAQQDRPFEMEQANMNMEQNGQPQMQPMEMNMDGRYKNNFGLNFPKNDLDNTEYHKNFIKSLKRYKGMAEESKNSAPEISNISTIDKTNLHNQPEKYEDEYKRRMLEDEEENKQTLKHSKLRRNLPSEDMQQCQEEPQDSKAPSKHAEDNKLEEQQENGGRTRRKSQHLEYEIKVINHNPQGNGNSELSHGSRRLEKDIKTKASEDKYLKKYPYSQVSRDDLTWVEDSRSDKKFKRTLPVFNRQEQKSSIQTRAVPSGYYSNRVKFGQKNFAKTSERGNSDLTYLRQSHMPLPSLTGQQPDKSKILRSWEAPQPDYKHEPMKRYDESGFSNKGNPLFLVRKGDHTPISFEEGSAPVPSDDMNPENYAKVLSNSNDYIVLKKTDSSKFQKITDSSPTLTSVQFSDISYPTAYSSEGQDNTKNKNMFARSFRFDKEKKFSSGVHGSKSNLKKTFDKFRDLAGFFKDNEQESADNQYSAQELKEGRDIVFSEDKLPDPIVINDGTDKSQGFNQKPVNSIYSISNNFKNLDQQDKKSDVPNRSETDKTMLTAAVKSDNSEYNWEPTLRNIFPEAKSINSVSKNGNEIIILDLNRNHLKKVGHSLMEKTNEKMMTNSQSPTNSAPSGQTFTDKKYQLNPSLFGGNLKPSQKNSIKGSVHLNKPKIAENAISAQIGDLPALLKTLMEGKPTAAKVITKRSLTRASAPSENCSKFLKDLNELSELNKSTLKNSKLQKKRNTENNEALKKHGSSDLSTYSDANLKYLGSLLHDLMNSKFDGVSEQFEVTDHGNLRRAGEDQKLSLNTRIIEPDQNIKYYSQWSIAEDKNKNFPSVGGNSEKYSFLRADEHNLKEGLAAVSDEINKLRREGAGKRELRKTADDSISFKEKSAMSSASKGLDAEEKCSSDIKRSSGTNENSAGKLPESDTHLSEFFEALNKNQNQKDHVIQPNESTWKRKKRKENHRQKRSADVDNNKVSTTAVHNTILKNLAEDNYQSVYSSGIKRRLFSTNKEADDADNFSDAYKHDNGVIADEVEAKCVKNKLNKCVDPIIVELFRGVDEQEEKSRARRSLNTGFHSNFKREIDLDESLPNDFQNFLVTSLGSFGSQKPEFMKKDDALWEGREGSQDSSSQIIDGFPGGLEISQSSALEKRDVTSSEKRKSQAYKKEFMGPDNGVNSNMVNVMGPLHRTEKNVRSDDKVKAKGKTEFTDEKLPTQIRIQITNASSKEKKSSKPIMDESETTSTETESLPKEKEFFDKSKVSTIRGNNFPKLRAPPKPKFSYSDFDKPDSQNNGQLYHRRRRKKKKYIAENPMKPIQDFVKFDQKTMETFLKKVLEDQNAYSDQSAQKNAAGSHLQQVDTNFNPAQGTSKAPMDTNRFNKINPGTTKSTGSIKSFQNTEVSGPSDEGIYMNYMKDKPEKIKSEKAKELGDLDWKPSLNKMKSRQELPWDSMVGNSQPTPAMEPAPSDQPSMGSPYNQQMFSQKMQVPNSNGLFRPGTSSILFDNFKLKQDIKSPNAPANDFMGGKLYKKPIGFAKSKEKDKMQNNMYPGEQSWNYDYSIPKKTTTQSFRNRPLFLPKSQNHQEVKSKMSRKFINNFDSPGKLQLGLGSPFSNLMMDNSKDSDYLDGIDEEYIDDLERIKDQQSNDNSGLSSSFKKSSKLFETPSFHRLYSYKNSDVDDNMNEDDEEIDEDYDENSEDDDLDDYSLLANTKAMDSDLMRTGHGENKFQSSFQPSSVLSPFSYPFMKDHSLKLSERSFEPGFSNFRSNAKFNQGRQFPLADTKSEIESMSSSAGILKKANENSNILEKNFMHNGFGLNFGESMKSHEKTQEKNGDMNPIYHHNKVSKRRLEMEGAFKRNLNHPMIGTRMYFASKTEGDDLSPIFTKYSQPKKGRSSRHIFYRPNSLNAEFADPDNNFDSESEENGKRFNDNIISLGKSSSEEDSKEEEDLDEVTENLEDGGETISEDNVLENVIGKYIMRKRVAPPEELNKAPETPLKKKESEIEEDHKVTKRSLSGKSKYDEEFPNSKMVMKRLSSGHLTENNFRKYHKKNLSGIRQTYDLDADTESGVSSDKSPYKKTKKRENSSLMKRSALDIFKKITSKDRDSKKVESGDGRTAGFEPLSSLSDKKYENFLEQKTDFPTQLKLSSENPQNQFQNTLVQFKGRYPNEIPLDVEPRKKEKVRVHDKDNLVTSEIEIQEKRENKLGNPSLKGISLDSIKRVAGAPEESKNLKRFLMFNSEPSADKQAFAEETPPTAGSFQNEVGKSYGPKFGEGKGISKGLVRKPSSDPSLVTSDEDAGQTPRGHFANEQITETHVNLKEKNRALHDTMSLSEGDSIPHPPQMLQRNTKKSESFVTADEKCRNARFPSLGSLNIRKSVFPPSNDANILRDSRHINEETSKYLGEQIVDAILSHVSGNPKFKELIAPGLSARMTVSKEDIDITQKPLHQEDNSEQLQFFLQKFLLDLEKLAEKHVKKRMCNEIDDQSKRFLQSLLGFSENAPKKHKSDKKNFCRCPAEITDPEDFFKLSVTMDEPESDLKNMTSLEAEVEAPSTIVAQDIENLKQKHCLLLKLIEDYDKLSKFEKDSLGVKYDQLMRELKSIRAQLSLFNTTAVRKMLSQSEEQNSDTDSESKACDACKCSKTKPVKKKCRPNDTSHRNCEKKNGTSPTVLFDNDAAVANSSSTTIIPLFFGDHSDQSDDTPKTKIQVPAIIFEEDTDRQEMKIKKTSPLPLFFEHVDSMDSMNSESSTADNQQKNAKPVKNASSIIQPESPQCFDLLICPNNTKKSDSPLITDLHTQTVDNVYYKQASSGIRSVNNSDSTQYGDLLWNYLRPTELNKLSLGDAAGLQLSLKNRGPWVSNLDVAKSNRHVSSLRQPRGNPSERSQPLQEKVLGASDPPLVEAPLSSGNLMTFNGDYPTSVGPKHNFLFSFYPTVLPRELFTVKKNPFESVSDHKWPDKKPAFDIPLNYFFRGDEKKMYLLKSTFIPQSKLIAFPRHNEPSSLKTYRDVRSKVSPRFPVPRTSTSTKRKSKKSEGSKTVEMSVDDNDVEYLAWSTMPAVRRQLNNLEAGFEFDQIFVKNPKTKKT